MAPSLFDWLIPSFTNRNPNRISILSVQMINYLGHNLVFYGPKINILFMFCGHKFAGFEDTKILICAH